MRRDDRVEFAAIPLALALLAAGALLVLSVATEQWAWMLVAVPVSAVALLVAWALRSRQRPPPEMAPRTGGSGDGVHRILVVADEGLTSSAFRDAIKLSAQAGPTEAFVTAPALASRLGRLTGDEGSYTEARRHLEETLRELAAIGVDARGEIGARDPIQAADDALRVFAADELVFATHAESDANWLEQDVVEIARNRYGVPVTHIAVDSPTRPDAGS
jgi:GABA permease